jgi:hypothetical protein
MAAAICIAGQYRTHLHTRESLVKHIFTPLSHTFHTVDIFYVLAESDKERSLLINRGVIYRDIEPARSVRSQQFVRFRLCRDLIRARNITYKLAIRTRPDLLFTTSLPKDSLNSTTLLAKLRCVNGHVTPRVHIHELSQELHFAKTCHLPSCGPTSTWIDDQFAIIPERLIDVYFSAHHNRSWTTNRTLEGPGFPRYLPSNNVFTLTRSFVDMGGIFGTLNFPFCIQRTSHACSVPKDRVISCKRSQ